MACAGGLGEDLTGNRGYSQSIAIRVSSLVMVLVLVLVLVSVSGLTEFGEPEGPRYQ